LRPLGDTDGSEVLTITVTGVPTGAALNHGTDFGGGVWLVSGAELPGSRSSRPPTATPTSR
jgi:hypothetical protein